MTPSLLSRALLATAALALAPTAGAQVMAPEFAADYSITDLGIVAGLPGSNGGLTFLDENTLLIGGAANTASGSLYTIGVQRDANQHITGFIGTAERFGGANGTVGEFNDGGVVIGPGGVIFTARYPSNALGQTKPGSIDEDKIIDLAALGMAPSSSSVNFVPTGFGGAGLIKLASWSGGQFYSASVIPDGSGTFDLVGFARVDLDPNLAGIQNLPGGPEGFVYIAAGSPGFTSPTMLVSEYSDGNVAAFELDADGNPLTATRRTFVQGLSGAEGAAIDPLTGDFLFSTFGSGNRVVLVSGFAAPIPEPGTWLLLASGMAALSLRLRQRRS